MNMKLKEIPADEKTVSVRDRWEMSRAGLFNFWCYEDEEFTLESGRLILRGTNGAGKSVTMQSFLPLVLDGDKRPHRLDPFGSRDRRIEYYLLGEGDHSSRISYIWLEFYHPVKQLYKTIGIGLKAQKGGAKAFAGVDEENIRDLFALLTDMDFDYMMTSQVLWGCYDTVPRLAISEIYRPKDADFVSVFRYRWNGKRKELLETERSE
jgi:hypothetical protein